MILLMLLIQALGAEASESFYGGSLPCALFLGHSGDPVLEEQAFNFYRDLLHQYREIIGDEDAFRSILETAIGKEDYFSFPSRGGVTSASEVFARLGQSEFGTSPSFGARVRSHLQDLIRQTNESQAQADEVVRAARPTLSGPRIFDSSDIDYVFESSAVSPDGRYALTTDAGNYVAYRDLESGKTLGLAKEATTSRKYIERTISPDFRQMIYPTYEGTVIHWDLNSGVQREIPLPTKLGHAAIEINWETQQLILADPARQPTYRGESMIWPFGRPEEAKPIHFPAFVDRAINWETEEVIGTTLSGDLQLWHWSADSIDKAQKIYDLKPSLGEIHSYSVDWKGRRALVRTKTAAVALIDLTTGDSRVLDYHGTGAEKDSKLFANWNLGKAITVSDGSYRVWDVNSGKVLIEKPLDLGSPTGVAVDSDFKFALISGERGFIHLDLSGGEILFEYPKHSLLFSVNGSFDTFLIKLGHFNDRSGNRLMVVKKKVWLIHR